MPQALLKEVHRRGRQPEELLAPQEHQKLLVLPLLEDKQVLPELLVLLAVQLARKHQEDPELQVPQVLQLVQDLQGDPEPLALQALQLVQDPQEEVQAQAQGQSAGRFP